MVEIDLTLPKFLDRRGGAKLDWYVERALPPETRDETIRQTANFCRQALARTKKAKRRARLQTKKEKQPAAIIERRERELRG